ncbi:MAG: DUF4332 domain-containing protein [bacterium]
MSIDPTSPVAVIEGIGQARAEALSGIHVFNVFDLLRATISQLHDALKTGASEAQIRSWRNMASLLQVDQINPQWAEALDSGGIDSIDELSTKNLDDLHTLFSEAYDKHLIPEVPGPAQITDMIRDATIIRLCGVLTLTIRDRDGNPVVGAKARIGDNVAHADAHGRVRLVRVQLGSGLPLIVEHEEHGLLLVDNPPVIPDHHAIGVTILSMPEPGSVDDASSNRLSEYEGDILPLSGNIPTREVTLSSDKLRERDLLYVCSFYKSAPDVKLASMLKSQGKGEIIVYNYRVPLSDLDTPPDVGDMFIYRGGKFIPWKSSVDRIIRYKIRMRMEKAFSDRPAPTTVSEMNHDMEERINWMEENGGFTGYARWES